KVNFIRYADDFIVTAATKELIEENIIPAIKDFLKPRGLTLSEEKTKITHIDEGFDFLGQHLQKYRNKLIITPSQRSVKDFTSKIKEIIKISQGKACDMIKALKPRIRGWSEYHKCIQASKAFRHADDVMFKSLWYWARRRHPKKSCGWIIKQYFSNSKRKWDFCAWSKTKTGGKKLEELLRISYTKLVRYIKIKGEANPYDPEYISYFVMRRISSNTCAI
ncbi:MAG: group II intron reverse transcriptase/maturase, partial [Bacteroidia bacterium]|nr:group II intron reverse transcriptase/maturase [Bacteroidia bacterium]